MHPSGSSAANDRYQAFLKVHRENKARLKALSPQALATDPGARLNGEDEVDSKVSDHVAQILDLASPDGAFRSSRFNFSQHGPTKRPSRRKDCGESIYAFGSRLARQ